MDTFIRTNDSTCRVSAYPVATSTFQSLPMKKLRGAYGPTGYAIYDMLVNEVIRQGSFVSATTSLFSRIARYWDVSVSQVREVVDYCLQLGLFNLHLFQEYNILTSADLQRIPVEQHYGPMSEVAPGWKLRVLLAQALFSNPDILLLDEPTNNLDIDTIRWLEQTLNDRDSTMIIISHDRHFLNMVCTHMADLDYGELRVYPGNYDEYMTAATQARERLLADNAKKKAQIADLQSFVSRFSANASKSRQATSRARQIDKIKLEEVKASSRQNPFIRFEQDKKLFRNALEVEALTKGFDEGPLFKNVNLLLEVGEKIAILGANGVGKSTMLKTLVGELQPDNGSVKWSENAQIGYYAQDHEYEFENDLTVFEWMSQWKQEGDDEQAVRSILGRLLFSQDDIKKPAKVLSGGEKGRMLFGKLMMQKPNILVMDEPTNHLDMESIESLNMALEMYQGTLIFVSHDREFVSSLATRVLEITPDRVIDFSGNYEDYLRSKGIE